MKILTLLFFVILSTNQLEAQNLILADTFPVIVDTIKLIDEKEFKCLSDNVYYEAPSESYQGRLAVATVTLNRAESKHFPNTICGVVYQRNKRGCQFSWVCEKPRKKDPVLYAKAEEVAEAALYKNERAKGVESAVYFHHVRLGRPVWTLDLKRLKSIGAHVFYSWRKQ